jgi:type I restriction enzyme S subunit
LGEVPEAWRVERLKYSVSINDEALPETTDPDFEFKYVDIGSVDGDIGIIKKELMIFESAPSRARRKVKSGDVIVSTVRTYLKAIAPISDENENTIVSTGFAVIRPLKICAKFLSYALRESSFVESVVARSVGVSYPAVNSSDIGGITIPLPSGDEQTAIADFLDRESGRLDTLIAKKHALIGLLKEKRTALISQTVTRGLPADAAREFGLEPHTRFKDSGIEWLGEIPEGWGITRLKYAMNKIVDCPHETPQYDPEGEYYVVRTADLDLGSLSLNSAYRVDKTEYCVRIRRSQIEAGDILYGREGERWGFAATAPDGPNICLGQRMMQFRAALTHHARFLMWHLNASCVYEQGALDTTGSTAPHVNVSTIRNYCLVVPPLLEQTAIATYLDRETTIIDTLIAKVQAAIERLQEYRTALITAAVTGKIDVRHYASKKEAA